MKPAASVAAGGEEQEGKPQGGQKATESMADNVQEDAAVAGAGAGQGSRGSLEELAMEDVGQDAAQPEDAAAPHIDSERWPPTSPVPARAVSNCTCVSEPDTGRAVSASVRVGSANRMD
jgi:hypothetical protein